jgi:hypothetical protein
MSSLQLVQLGSNPFKPQKMFTAFQTLGNTTTLPAYVTNLGIPVAIAGDTGVNPRGVYDNTDRRMVSLILAFAVTAADNTKAAVRVTGYSQIATTGLYLRTNFFVGEAQGGNVDISTAMGETTAFACDNFSLKTLATPNVSYIEPNADSSFALLIVDIRGFEYVAVDLAQGTATAATKVQVFYGVN